MIKVFLHKDKREYDYMRCYSAVSYTEEVGRVVITEASCLIFFIRYLTFFSVPFQWPIVELKILLR